MRRIHTLCATTLVFVAAACAAPTEDPAPSQPTSPTAPPAEGGGGALPEMPEGGAGGTTPPPPEQPSYATAVGAAYASASDARIVLVDVTGTRSSQYNPSTGMFSSPDDIDELEGGLPIADVVAAANVGEVTYLFDASGQVTLYDRAQATFTAPEALAEALEDVPFSAVGAAFGAGDTLFVFNTGGTQYAAFNTADETWSPVYGFATDFGGGGAPIANVGAAYADAQGGYVLFDLSGDKFCIYAGSGTFSDDFDIDELGDGMLTFDDVDD